jgi:hypothetical protein
MKTTYEWTYTAILLGESWAGSPDVNKSAHSARMGAVPPGRLVGGIVEAADEKAAREEIQKVYGETKFSLIDLQRRNMASIHGL